MHRSCCSTPLRRNCVENVVLPVPGGPVMATIKPSGIPPSTKLSKPMTPVEIRLNFRLTKLESIFPLWYFSPRFSKAFSKTSFLPPSSCSNLSIILYDSTLNVVCIGRFRTKYNHPKLTCIMNRSPQNLRAQLWVIYRVHTSNNYLRNTNNVHAIFSGIVKL